MKNNKTLKYAIIKTLPILTGFLFMGISYGIYATSKGLPFYIPILTSIFMEAGSMEFVGVNLLTSAFNPLNCIFITLMVNARHIFYGLTMLNIYTKENLGEKHYRFHKLHLIFGLCDETFSINYQNTVKEGIDKSKFIKYVSTLNHIYWITGCTIGALFGSFIKFNTLGIDFVMTALFVVIFINQFKESKSKYPGFIGIIVTVACLLIFPKDYFLIPSFIIIIVILVIFKNKLRKGETE